MQVLGSRSSARAVSFLYALLSWNPSWRSTAQEALKHSYFRNAKSNNPELASSMAQNDDHEQPLSLALRPRGQNSVTAATTATTATTAMTSEEADGGGGNVGGGRKPFPMAEIEPHYSREPTQMKPQQLTEDKTDQDNKNNNNNTINGKLTSNLAEQQNMTDDINDILSAFSIGVVGDASAAAPPVSKSRASQRRRLRNVVMMSPAASASGNIKDKMPKFSNIEVNGDGQPSPSHSPRRFSVYKSKHQQRLWNGGIGLGGNFPAHHIVHAHHHGPHHHHHHLHHFGDSKIVDLSPNASKFNFVFNGKPKNSPDKTDADDSVKMSPKVRFGSKPNPETPKYGRSPMHVSGSGSVYQFSVSGNKRAVSQVSCLDKVFLAPVLSHLYLCSPHSWG